MTLEKVFAELRPAMFALAYRITGNRADAEEIVQDAFVRLHNTGPKDAVRSFKAYLTTITARLSFNRLRDQRARRETYVGEWLPEPLATAGEADVHPEDVSFALVAVLERLSPLERVVFVLRSAFDFSFKEIAPVARRDPVACRQIFGRARARMREERPRFSVDRERHRELLLSFANAARGGDKARLVSILSGDAVLRGDGGGKALATKKPVVGAGAVAQFVVAVTHTVPPEVTFDEIDLNGTPGLVLRSAGRPLVAIRIGTDGERIRAVVGVARVDELAALARPPASGA